MIAALMENFKPPTFFRTHVRAGAVGSTTTILQQFLCVELHRKPLSGYGIQQSGARKLQIAVIGKQ